MESRVELLTCDPRSAVMETLEAADRVDDVAGGKDADVGADDLAVITGKITTLIIKWRHCFRVQVFID